MTVEELRWFVAVAERGRVTEAAEELHVSQPALSRALARLQAQLGVPLFDRRGRTLQLNRYGKLFRDHARRALAELDAARLGLADVTGAGRGLVPLAFLHTLGTWLLPALVSAYRAECPDVDFRLVQSGAGAMLQALRDGDVDLILTSPEPEEPGIAWVPLATEPLRLAVAPTHRLATRSRVRLAEVAEDPHVVIRAEYGLRAITDDLCRRAGFEPKVAFEGEDVATLRGLVAAGLGVAILPPLHAAGVEIAPPTPHLQVTDPGCQRTIGLAWDEARYRSPAVEAFRAFVMRHGRGIAAPTAKR